MGLQYDSITSIKVSVGSIIQYTLCTGICRGLSIPRTSSAFGSKPPPAGASPATTGISTVCRWVRRPTGSMAKYLSIEEIRYSGLLVISPSMNFDSRHSGFRLGHQYRHLFQESGDLLGQYIGDKRVHEFRFSSQPHPVVSVKLSGNSVRTTRPSSRN